MSHPLIPPPLADIAPQLLNYLRLLARPNAQQGWPEFLALLVRDVEGLGLALVWQEPRPLGWCELWRLPPAAATFVEQGRRWEVILPEVVPGPLAHAKRSRFSPALWPVPAAEVLVARRPAVAPAGPPPRDLAAVLGRVLELVPPGEVEVAAWLRAVAANARAAAPDPAALPWSFHQLPANDAAVLTALGDLTGPHPPAPETHP